MQLLSACGHQPATAAPAIQAPVPAPVGNAHVPDPDEINALLDAGAAALERGQLMSPAHGSALSSFDTALALDPGNLEARRGLERVVEQYLQMASEATENHHFARARSMLDRARIVDPEHPGIGPVKSRLRLLTEADRRRLRIDRRQLRDRNPALRRALAELGASARDPECRAEIRVPSDAHGRWVYQQMSTAPGDRRIRAQIHIGAPPQVELLCFRQNP